MATPDQLVNIQTRNQVFLERLKTGEHKKFIPFLKRISTAIRARLLEEGETIESKRRLNALLSDLTAIQNGVYDDYIQQLSLDLETIGIDQAEFQGDALNSVIVDFEADTPAPQQLLTAFRVTPMSVEGLGTKPLLEPFIKDWSKTATQRVNTTIQQGFTQGKTTAEIIRDVKGTRGAKFNDGVLAKVNRDAAAIVRTSVQHVASTAQHKVLKENDIEQYEWISTLDSKTSSQCKNLDGMIFDLGKGPTPPVHINCRSSTAPIISDEFDFLDKGAKRAARGADGGEQAPASTTYYSWLKTQPAAFQDSAVGTTRGKLLRNGGLSSEEFQQLSMGRNFKDITLKEMQRKRPEVFEQANVEL